MSLDPYAELRVARDASQAEIKKAFRRRIREVHPDKHPDDPHASAKAQQVQEAYEILSDAARRDAYDNKGTTARPPDLAQLARQMIVSIFAECLNDMTITSYVAVLKSRVKMKMINARRNAQAGGEANVRLRAVKARISCAAGENLLEMTLDQAIEANSEKIAIVSQTENIAKRALEILNDYDDVDLVRLGSGASATSTLTTSAFWT